MTEVEAILKATKIIDKQAKALRDLDNVVKIQKSPGNYDANEYMWGMANGLILAQAIMLDIDPKYLGKPKRFLD